MCNLLSNFSASAGPIICSYTPNIANKTVAAKEMIFTISRIVLIKAVILVQRDRQGMSKCYVINTVYSKQADSKD